jgi:tRNA uridine 5-carboxymethylaminomethyl modification enzyme
MADASSSLSASLQEMGFQVGRFKTGTPCRLNGRSIDFTRCSIQLGDEPPSGFTFNPEEIGTGVGEIFTLNRVRDGQFHVEQLPCWITHTTQKTHEIIRANLHRSPLYAGRIQGVGPRYCPSIEDKVVKFSDKASHQLFLEPEGRHTSEYYVNGISTSLPYEVQLAFYIQSQGSSKPRSCGLATRLNMITSRRHNFCRHSKRRLSADSTLPAKSMAPRGMKRQQHKD